LAQLLRYFENSVNWGKGGKKMRVLVVEDELGIQMVIKKFLESHEVVVHVCDNGREAVRLATTGGYDVVLLDYHLPGWTGVEAVSALDLLNRNLKIVVNTGYDIYELKDALKDYDNVVSFVSKPFNLNELWDVLLEATKA
jgi:two-component system response regulator VanR